MSDTAGLQDGMLTHYQTQARASDVNVEARLDKEPFDYRGYLNYRKRVAEGRIESVLCDFIERHKPIK